MKKYLALLPIVMLTVVVVGIPVVHAQPLEEGRWVGQMAHPTGAYLNLSFTVSMAGDSLQITLEVPSFQSFPLHNARLEGDQLSFWWRASVRLTCSLDRQRDGSFQGGCVDTWGGRGPLVMIPPGLDPESVTIDEEVFFAEWEPPETMKTSAERLADEEVRPGTAVDIGGYRLNVQTMGAGDVTVVLEAGLGDDLGVWNKVLPNVAKHVRVVAYDRAGLGYSDSSPSSRTPEQIATELHALLRRAGIAPPYVLVGHAEGGFSVRRFASLYPGEVAGLVLVDASHEAQGARWRALDSASWETYVDQKRTFYAIIQGPLQAEYEAFLKVMEEQEVPGVGPLPDVPIAVLTAMRPVEEPRYIGETEKGLQDKYEWHKAWVDHAKQGVHYVTKTSGPYVHREEPKLVVKAIREVVEAATADGRR